MRNFREVCHLYPNEGGGGGGGGGGVRGARKEVGPEFYPIGSADFNNLCHSNADLGPAVAGLALLSVFEST